MHVYIYIHIYLSILIYIYTNIKIHTHRKHPTTGQPELPSFVVLCIPARCLGAAQSKAGPQ